MLVYHALRNTWRKLVDKKVDLADGVELNEVKVSTFDLVAGQAALIVHEDGVTMVTPNKDGGEAVVTRAVLFVVGLYFASADPAFVEKIIRVGIDNLRKGGIEALEASQGIPV